MRHAFGGSPSDYAMEKVGNQLLLRPEAVGTVWDAATGGTQITDLEDPTGAAITTVTAAEDASVVFYGPDGVTFLYVDFGYERRFALAAMDLGDAFDTFLAQGGIADGWATLDSSGVVPAAQLPKAVDWYIVTSPVYGAHADGTTDDSGALQAAINAASVAGGGTVYLPTGFYKVSTALVPQSGVRLLGGPGAVLFHSGNSNIIYGSGVEFTDFTVEGLTFTGTVDEFPATPKRARTTSGPGTQTAIFLSGDLDTTGSGQAPLTNFTMRNCTVRNCSALPIRIGGVRGKVSVTGCHFENNQDVGFLFCSEVIFVGNHVLQSADNGVSLSRGCKKVTCAGNTFENCAYNGIWVSGFLTDKGPNNFTVSGNVVRNIGYNGIYADYAPKYGAITGNEIDCGYYRGPSDQATDINGSGIYLGGYPVTDRTTPTDWAQGITVVGNHIRTAARAGIYMNGAKRVQVVANQISDVGTQYLADGTTAISSSDATQNVGILMENSTTSSDVTVALNAVVDSRTTAYCNYGLVPQNTAGINAYLNTMIGTRQASTCSRPGRPARCRRSGCSTRTSRPSAAPPPARTPQRARSRAIASTELPAHRGRSPGRPPG